MSFDWDLFSRYLTPILGAAAGALINRRIERQPQLVSYIAHSSAVNVKLSDGGTMAVNSHSVVIRNAGRKAANNVRLGHTALPSFSVFPPCEYQTIQLPENSGTEICFPILIPEQQITITYLYFPPVLWSGMNTYAKSDEGFAKIINVLPTPQPSLPILWATRFLIVMGAATTLYVATKLITNFFQFVSHA